MSTRACTSGKLIESGRSVITQKTCINDAIKLWNKAPKLKLKLLKFNIVKIFHKFPALKFY